MEQNGISRAVAAAGGAPQLAAKLGVSRQVVLQWVAAGFAPPGRARQIDFHTGVDRRALVDPVIRDLFDYQG